jgi:alanyl-tRNA synthetase
MGDVEASVEQVAGLAFAGRNLGDIPARDLKGLAEAIQKQLSSGVVALVSTADGRASIVVAVSPDLASRFNAVDLVRLASPSVGGKGGGGRPDLAQAGGPNVDGADDALAVVRSALLKG